MACAMAGGVIVANSTKNAMQYFLGAFLGFKTLLLTIDGVGRSHEPIRQTEQAEIPRSTLAAAYPTAIPGVIPVTVAISIRLNLAVAVSDLIRIAIRTLLAVPDAILSLVSGRCQLGAGTKGQYQSGCDERASVH